MPSARHTSATATDTWHDRAGGRRGEADAADEASQPLLHEVRCHAPGLPWGVCITGQSHLLCVGRQKGSPHDSTRSISGCLVNSLT
jgi:hypothetical protein